MAIEIEVSVGPDWQKKALVVSHERSGTHFLMNTLADNFGYVSLPWIDLDFRMAINFYAPKSILNFIEGSKDQAVINTFKSHHQIDFFLPVLDELLDNFHVFYIHRPAKDVFPSFCKHLNNIVWDAGPKVDNPDLLMGIEPAGALLRYQKVQYPSMLERWRQHVKGWQLKPTLEQAQKIVYVQFNDLLNDFEATVMEIGKRINRSLPKKIIKPIKEERIVK